MENMEKEVLNKSDLENVFGGYEKIDDCPKDKYWLLDYTCRQVNALPKKTITQIIDGMKGTGMGSMCVEKYGEDQIRNFIKANFRSTTYLPEN